MARGVLLIICGPSGVGKTSICDGLLARRKSLGLSISYTTRERRGEEVDGRDYHFVDEDRFLQMRRDNCFAEWAEVHGNFYGTSRAVIEKAWAEGRDLLFDIDYQGARQLKEHIPTATAILVSPPDLSTLEERLRGRGTDTEEVIQRRLQAARDELAQHELFDYIVENRHLDEAIDVVEAIYVAARHAHHLHADKIEQMLDR